LFFPPAHALLSLTFFMVNFLGCRKLLSNSYAKVMKVKSVPTSRAG